MRHSGLVRAFSVPPNTYGIVFGLTGLAAMWAAMQPITASVRPVVLGLTVLATAVWLALLVTSFLRYRPKGAFVCDMDDPILGPFVSLIFIDAVMLGMLWTSLGVGQARYLVVAGAVLALAYGGLITGHWIADEFPKDLLHPGFFLPTVAGGLVSATALQKVGYHDLAMMAFGIGMICWLVLGSVLLQRLFVGAPLPTALIPLLAIELAPPAVAGNAWVALYPQANPVQFALGAYTIFMAIVQLRLVPKYRQVPFGPTFWAFTFSYAAAGTYALHWLGLERGPATAVIAWVLVILMTGFIGWIAVRSLQKMRAGSYFPPAQPVVKTSLA